MRFSSLTLARTPGLPHYLTSLAQSSASAVNAAAQALDTLSVGFMQALVSSCGPLGRTPVLRLIQASERLPASVSYHDGAVNLLLFWDAQTQRARLLYRGVQGPNDFRGTGNHLADVSTLTTAGAREALQAKIQRLARGARLSGARPLATVPPLRCVAAIAQLPHLQGC